MNKYKNEHSVSPNFSLAFQQMVSFAAIAKVRNLSEVLDELILQCYVILPSEPLNSPATLIKIIDALFGIKLLEKNVAISLDRLLSRQYLIKLPGNHLGLSQDVQARLTTRIQEARALESDVKEAWLQQVAANAQLPKEKLWNVLMLYLAQAFKRHGIQAVSLLDPASQVSQEQLGSLSSILDTLVHDNIPQVQRDIARKTIASFIADVRTDRKRAEYIAQLADSAFNYFSLMISPEISARLREKLNPLVLFLDTNFIFGILQIHTNPQVDVSNELLEAVKQFNLPFKLRYHEFTVRETTNTLYHFGGELRKHRWSQNISRAAAKSERVSGIELRFHQKNAVVPIEVDDFMSPYKHWEIMLKDKGIDIYRLAGNNAQLAKRADLEADYKTYLKCHHMERSYEAVQHDMAVLETVESLRSKAASSLDAGALLITCDYQLYRFDAEKSRKDGTLSCTILPNLLWQILRPFISSNEEFDRAFAETFALPEFTLSKGGAAKAASKMLSILASYSGLPEETASKMLANDLLFAELQTKPTDKAFQDAVETEMSRLNIALVEEKAALQGELEGKHKQTADRDRRLAQAEDALNKTKQELEARDNTISRLQNERNDEARRTYTSVADAETQRSERDGVVSELGKQQRKALTIAKITSISGGILIALLFELIVNYVIPWQWLLRNSNSYGLQASISLMLIFLSVGACVKPWRKVFWIVGVFGLIFAILTMLGGPAPIKR